MNITVSIVEDDHDLRQTLVRYLDTTGFQCVSNHPNAEEALRELGQIKPNVVLMDINLPHQSGIECVAQLKALIPASKSIMLRAFEDADLIFQALAAGALGYMLKGVRPAKLLDSIRDLRVGGYGSAGVQPERPTVGGLHLLLGLSLSPTQVFDQPHPVVTQMGALPAEIKLPRVIFPIQSCQFNSGTDPVVDQLTQSFVVGGKLASCERHIPPSEWVGSHALRHTGPQSLVGSPESHTFKKFLSSKISLDRCGCTAILGLEKAA